MGTAPLSDAGYQAVAVHKDDEAMLKSVRRQLDIEPTADEKQAAEEKKKREEYWHKMKAADEKKAAEEALKSAEEKKKREQYWHKMKAADAAEKNAVEGNTAVEEALTVADENNGADDEGRAAE